MEKQWFVLHTLTGQENKAQRSIENRVKIERMEDFVGRCVIPTERMSEKKDGKKRTITRKFFPGYILCELALYDESKGLDENGQKSIYTRTWEFVRGTSGLITGKPFIGGDRPMPLKQSEVDAILNNNRKEQKPVPKVDFAVDETVKVTDGAFMGLTGQITMVDPDRGKLKVEVSIFNRKVQVDAEYWQVEKVSVEETFAALK